MRTAGFRLAEVADLLDAPRRRRAALAVAKRRELADTIRTARRAQRVLDRLMDCGCSSVDTCALVPAARQR